MNSEMDNKTICQQYFNLNEITYIPDIYELKQQPILVLTDQQQLQTITSLSNSTLQITQSSQISLDDQQHQITSHVSDLESINSNNNNNNCHSNYNKINNITKLSLIPIISNNSINNKKNLWLLQQTSDNSIINSNIKRHFKHRVTINHHSNQHPIYYSHNIKSNKFEYNSFSAPSSLISNTIATTYSQLKNEKIKENKQMNNEQLQLLLPTLSTVDLTNDNVQYDDHENCLNHKFLNDYDINLTENNIVITEPIQMTDQSFTNQSMTNDYKVNLLTSNECLSSSLENQKLDDLQYNTNLNNSSYINLDNGNCPIRSHSFFHLRQLDSLSSTGSYSKPDTDILYPMNGSFNQLAIRVSSSPISICSNNNFYQQNNCLEDQYNKTTFNGNTYGGSSNKNRRSKCEKYISPDKHTCIRSYSAMRHPNECNIRVFRSPLDVLSPCKGKKFCSIVLNIKFYSKNIL
ncbi:unnamed protein product [Schistosoma margrebowiei]|uniref:Uncharacterized protein n=1 Tax=Schistosoma margrebowiei TaxID=48269 RepID=A0A183LW16_9TREM|nr:unnamed protein product [Schistosoma margrebowiei]